ncbi:hypothetical protein SEA_DARWIN_66 [Corynebacterium phage Darwin]|uniref:Uncharacterized protein n=1 Tax=Corynebacterium phage Darwin TaxID=2047869 RepID=A0A2H4P8P5_9CAUD|nr:hypothetical protein FDJ11_gp82 [Corynebacterium phage Darwin]ATW58621.1 hypothetical protein SEA_DARWIN_66 [Corynebacterium phage Darwin]
MNVIKTFAVLEDGVEIGTFDACSLAVAHINKHAVKGRKYQVVKEFVIEEDKLPTVADTGWRDEYRGMWVEDMGTGRLYVLLSESEDMVFASDTRNCRPAALPKDSLIPRYDLAPVNLTPHPAYLETLEDYEGAPAHTVITYSWEGTFPDLVKYSNGAWVKVGVSNFDSSTNLAGTRLKVLYWPEEEK